jgi:hypothetical protein
MLLEEPSSSAAAGPARPRRLSELLREIADDTSRERIAIADLLLAMKDRAIGALLLIFALPNVLPTPPGTSTVLGAPLIFLAAQLALGRPPWLPKWIANRSIARRDFAALMNKAEPWLARAEKLLKPRFSAITRPPFEYGIGVVCFALAIILFLPIPLGNMLPALTICMLALGVLERDGVWIAAGVALTATSVVLVSGVVYAIVKSAIFILTNAFA